MPISEAIRSAIVLTFPPHRRAAVLDGLATIPEEGSDALRSGPSAEFLQAAVLALAYGDEAVFHMQLMNARVEPRDVIYAIQPPGKSTPP